MGKRDVTEIIRGSTIAQEKGFQNHRDMLRGIYATLNRQGSLVVDFVEEVDVSQPVTARVEHGRWGAHCECGGAEYVDPDDPVFYCFSCGNATADGKLRPVQFPANVEDIELLLLERPISTHKGTTKCSINLNSKPLLGIGRDWDPEDVDLSKIKEENKDHGLEDDVEKIKEKK